MSSSIDQVLRKANRLAKKGEVALAAQCYQSVLKRFPNNKRAAEGLKALQRIQAENTATRAGFSEQQFNGLTALYSQGRFQEALVRGEDLARQFPNVPIIPNFLGVVNANLGRQEQAVMSFKEALRLNPDYAEAHCHMGIALNNLDKSEEAVVSLKTAIRLMPGYAEAHNNLGAVLNRLGRSEQAISCFENALQLKPDYAEAHNNLGLALTHLGKSEEAVASFTKALQLKPDYAEAYYHLSRVKEYQKNEPDIDHMLKNISRPALTNKDRIYLKFALGKAYADIGDYDNSFACLIDGNRLRKEQTASVASNDRELFACVKSTFTKNVPVLNISKTSEDIEVKRPIFILRMPRSGTTLVEQILASHSQIYGAGELTLLANSVAQGDLLSDLPIDAKLTTIRKRYISGIEELGVLEQYIIDKNPLNFRFIGYIITALPDSKIIHLQRDARAICWSIFKHHFPRFEANQSFIHDLKDVVEYYKMYVDLMAFWHDKFPAQIHDLNYEVLTENQIEETRKLLEHVGLDWEDQCLEFHKTQRAVKTASSLQVRQKMYRGSSDEWRHYETHLEPMIEALKGF